MTGGSFVVRFEGADADRHQLNMRQLGESLIGFEHFVTFGLFAVETGRVPGAGDRLGFSVRVATPKAHCFAVGPSEGPAPRLRDRGCHGWRAAPDDRGSLGARRSRDDGDLHDRGRCRSAGVSRQDVGMIGVRVTVPISVRGLGPDGPKSGALCFRSGFLLGIVWQHVRIIQYNAVKYEHFGRIKAHAVTGDS